MPKRKRERTKRIVTIIVIIAIISGSSLLYYFSIVPLPPSSPFVAEFPTKRTAFPNAIAVDNQGRVWFASWNETALGVLYPSNGTVRMFPLPEPSSMGLETWGVTVDNSKGMVWFTDHISNAIWSFNITSRAFTKHAIPTIGSFPYQIALDDSGNVWFTESFGQKLGELTAQGKLKEYPVPKNGSFPGPFGIAIDNGTVWFTETDNNMIGSFHNGTYKMYNTTGFIYSPVGIAVDSQGNLWVTQHTNPGLIGEFNPRTHFVKTFSTSIPPNFASSLPYFIYVDSHGNVWFNEHQGNAIAVFDPATNSLAEYHVPLKFTVPGNLSGILTMALSNSGEPWFTELFTGNIGTINASAPFEQNLTVAKSETSIANGSSASLALSVQGGGALSAYSSNFTQSFNFNFSPRSGTANFSSTLVIQNNGAAPGVYFVTISDATRFITFSRVVEIDVP